MTTNLDGSVGDQQKELPPADGATKPLPLNQDVHDSLEAAATNPYASTTPTKVDTSSAGPGYDTNLGNMGDQKAGDSPADKLYNDIDIYNKPPAGGETDALNNATRAQVQGDGVPIVKTTPDGVQTFNPDGSVKNVSRDGTVTDVTPGRNGDGSGSPKGSDTGAGTNQRGPDGNTGSGGDRTAATTANQGDTSRTPSTPGGDHTVGSGSKASSPESTPSNNPHEVAATNALSGDRGGSGNPGVERGATTDTSPKTPSGEGNALRSTDTAGSTKTGTDQPGTTTQGGARTGTDQPGGTTSRPIDQPGSTKTGSGEPGSGTRSADQPQSGAGRGTSGETPSGQGTNRVDSTQKGGETATTKTPETPVRNDGAGGTTTNRPPESNALGGGNRGNETPGENRGTGRGGNETIENRGGNRGETPIDKGGTERVGDRGGDRGVADRGGERGGERGDRGGDRGAETGGGQKSDNRGGETTKGGETPQGGPKGGTDTTGGQGGANRGPNDGTSGQGGAGTGRGTETGGQGSPGRGQTDVTEGHGGTKSPDGPKDTGTGRGGSTEIAGTGQQTPVGRGSGSEGIPGREDKGGERRGGEGGGELPGGGREGRDGGIKVGGDGGSGGTTKGPQGGDKGPTDVTSPGGKGGTGTDPSTGRGEGRTGDVGGGKPGDTGKGGDTGGVKPGGDGPITGAIKDPVAKGPEGKQPDSPQGEKGEGGGTRGRGDTQLEGKGDVGKSDPGKGGQTGDAATGRSQTGTGPTDKAQPGDAASKPGAEYNKGSAGDGQYASGRSVRDALTNAGINFDDKASRMHLLDVMNKMQSGKLDQLDANGLKISQALAGMDPDRLSRIHAWLNRDANGTLGKDATGANLAALFDATGKWVGAGRFNGKEGHDALSELGRMAKDAANATGGDVVRQFNLNHFLSRGLESQQSEMNVMARRLVPGQEEVGRTLQDKIDALRQARQERMEGGEKVEGTLARGGKFESRGETLGQGKTPTGRQDFGARDDLSQRGADDWKGRKAEERDADGKVVGRSDLTDKLGDKREEEAKERKRREEEKEKEKEREAEAKRLSEAALAALATRKIKEDQERAEKEKIQEEERDKKEREKRQKYTVKEKDTLESIALAQLKDKKLAPLILEINKNTIPTRSENNKTIVSLKPKMIIWLPSPADTQTYRGRMPATVPQYQYDNTEYQTPEEELEARFGERFDRVDEAAADNQAAAESTETEGTQSRRENIEKLLGPLSSKPDTDNSGRLKYNVRLGDTLKSVAVRHPALGDVALWKLLAEVNKLPVSDEKGSGPPLKRGSHIFIPTAQEVEEYRLKTGLKAPKTAPPAAKSSKFGQAELVTKPCAGCGRLATLTAEICPGCGNPFVKAGDEKVGATQDFSPEPSSSLNFSVPEDDATKSVLSAFGWSDSPKPPAPPPAAPQAPPATDAPQQPATETTGVKETRKPGGLPIIKRSGQPADDSHTAPVRKMPSGIPMARKSESGPPPGDLGGDGVAQQLGDNARLVKTSASDGSFKTRLEVLHEGKWLLVMLYEISSGASVRHEFTLDGRRRTFNIDLPYEVARDIAETDINKDWRNYCSRFLAGKSISD